MPFSKDDNAPEILEPEIWPPNSPDLNPMDYGIRGTMESRMNFSRINNLDELRCYCGSMGLDFSRNC